MVAKYWRQVTDAELLDRVRRVAEREDRSTAAMLRLLVRRALQETEREVESQERGQ